MFVEFAYAPSRRNMFATTKQFAVVHRERAGKDQLLRSVFLYDPDEMMAHVKKEGSVAKFNGSVYPSHIFIDIDGHDITVKQLLKRLEECIVSLHITNSIPPECVQYFFSGRGFHVLINHKIFGLKGSPILNKVVAKVVEDICPFTWVDRIYDRTHIIRWTNCLNPNANRYKIPLDYSEIMVTSEEWFESIKELAKQPRLDFDGARFLESDQLIDLRGVARSAASQIQSLFNSGTTNKDRPILDNPMAENRRKMTCLHGMLSVDPEANRRHSTIGAAACIMRRQGMSLQDIAIPALTTWIRRGDGKVADNNSTYDNEHVAQQVRYWYEKGYAPSCTGQNKYSRVMQEHCSSECMFFLRRDIDGGVSHVEDNAALLKKRIKWIQEKRYIDAAKIMGGSMDTKFRIFPGTSLILLAATSMGKTMFLQWFGLQIKAPILWLSMEMDKASMMQRWIQQLIGCDEDMVPEAFARYEEQILNAVSHIHLVDRAMTVDEIVDKMHTSNIEICVIDSLQHLKDKMTSRDLRLKMVNLTEQIRQEAVTREYIFLTAAHVDRASARDGRITLHSGKESGSIENDAHIVMSLFAERKEDPWRKAEILKQTMGPTGHVFDLALNRETLQFFTQQDPMYPILTGRY